LFNPSFDASPFPFGSEAANLEYSILSAILGNPSPEANSPTDSTSVVPTTLRPHLLRTQGATHAVDFGTCDVSGTGPFTLDGRGVSVIVVGEKVKGNTKFYSVRGVKTEQSWIKKCTPSLVKTTT
jgi:hypothetical protein